MDTFGATFQPNTGNDEALRQQREPVQQAIQILALRLPRILGAQAAVPHDIFAQGGGFAPGDLSSVAQSLLQSLMRAGQNYPGVPSAPQTPPYEPPSSNKTPRVHAQDAPATTPPPPPMTPEQQRQRGLDKASQQWEGTYRPPNVSGYGQSRGVR